MSNNTWYLEVRTKRNQPARNEARGGTVTVRHDAEKLAQYRLRNAIEAHAEEGIEVTPAMQEILLADIRVAVAKWIEEQS